jgi:hypothetical protein
MITLDDKIFFGFSADYPDHYSPGRTQPTIAFFGSPDMFAKFASWLEERSDRTGGSERLNVVDQTLLVASGQNESAPQPGALPKFNRLEPQAAILVGLTSGSLLELAIGIARGFMASGISRTRLAHQSFDKDLNKIFFRI